MKRTFLATVKYSFDDEGCITHEGNAVLAGERSIWEDCILYELRTAGSEAVDVDIDSFHIEEVVTPTAEEDVQ